VASTKYLRMRGSIALPWRDYGATKMEHADIVKRMSLFTSSSIYKIDRSHKSRHRKCKHEKKKGMNGWSRTRTNKKSAGKTGNRRVFYCSQKKKSPRLGAMSCYVNA
jgi:hypothetical protein